MIKLLPEPKKIIFSGSAVKNVKELIFDLSNVADKTITAELRSIIDVKMWNFQDLKISVDARPGGGINQGAVTIKVYDVFTEEHLDKTIKQDLLKWMGYALDINGQQNEIFFSQTDGFVNSISTLKQLIKTPGKDGYHLPHVYVLDYPDFEIRSISTTFAWYAGYGRIGFDSQLWGFDEWKEFINICSDLKINQVNMCMYGYWPFDFDEFPDTILKDIEMEVWNEESKNWVTVKYTHPNISNEFLTELIDYSHKLGIRIFCYIGLNSYNGGYANIYKDKRMVLPSGGSFVNDFDTLCLSDLDNVEYLKKAMKRVVNLGLDGVIFEESEESYWFCNCEKCTQNYINKTHSAAESKHTANYRLLGILHKAIKDENPGCEVGLRAWREPPLEKEIEYLENCRDSIPADVCLYWAPGLYVGEDEFKKWVEIFGKERICARDTEANAWSSTQGRLFRMFKSNVLRSGEEVGDQFIEKDINQHLGSLKAGVRGINGYLFEWHEYFLHLFAHSNYGWGSEMGMETFYSHALKAVFGEKISEDILFILKNIVTIHESQISIFPTEFPFLRNKVNKDDIKAIEKAKDNWETISALINKVRDYLQQDEKLSIYVRHFDKIENSHRRNRVIYDMCLSTIGYDNAVDEAEKKRFLKEIEMYNEKDFDLVKKMFFDVNPVENTGVKSCMYPYHEIKRVLGNMRNPDDIDEEIIYLGVEALGWLWLK